jgi:hypothetical protein
MAYVGYIAHQLPGRIRIRVEGDRGDRAFFDRLVADISGAPSVTGVRANPRASSVAVSFDPRKGDIRTALEASKLFEFRERAPAPARAEPRPPAKPLDRDEALAVGLTGLGVVQLANGKAVGPASENLWNAYRARTHLANNGAALALTLVGLFQILRGDYLNSASALFFYALTARQLAKERRAAAGRERPKPAARRAAPAPTPTRRERADRGPRAPAR